MFVPGSNMQSVPPIIRPSDPQAVSDEFGVRRLAYIMRAGHKRQTDKESQNKIHRSPKYKNKYRIKRKNKK